MVGVGDNCQARHGNRLHRLDPVVFTVEHSLINQVRRLDNTNCLCTMQLEPNLMHLQVLQMAKVSGVQRLRDPANRPSMLKTVHGLRRKMLC